MISLCKSLKKVGSAGLRQILNPKPWLSTKPGTELSPEPGTELGLARSVQSPNREVWSSGFRV